MYIVLGRGFNVGSYYIALLPSRQTYDAYSKGQKYGVCKPVHLATACQVGHAPGSLWQPLNTDTGRPGDPGPRTGASVLSIALSLTLSRSKLPDIENVVCYFRCYNLALLIVKVYLAFV